MKRKATRQAVEDQPGPEDDSEGDPWDEDYGDPEAPHDQPRLTLAIPAAGQGTPTHAAALKLLARRWPKHGVFGPDPSWDHIYSPFGARSYLAGANVIVLMPWKGYFSHGIAWMANVAPRILTARGGVYLLDGGVLYTKWKTEPVPKPQKTNARWVRVTPTSPEPARARR